MASGLWAIVVVLAVAASAARPPDELIPNGHPCCPIPDSWAEVAVWSVGALVAAAIATAMLAGGVACLVFAARHRRPADKFLWLPLWGAAGVAAVLAGVLGTRML